MSLSPLLHPSSDVLALARRVLAEHDQHPSLVATATELVQRLVVAEECWFLEPSPLTRLVTHACSRRSAWTLNLSDLEGTVCGYSVGELALVPVALDGEVAALAARRPQPGSWRSEDLAVLAGIGAEFGQRMVETQALQISATQRARADFDRLRSQLMQTLNHELRTPLTVISGTLEMLAETDDPQLRASLNSSLRRSVSRLRAMADSLTQHGAAARLAEAEPTCDLRQVVLDALLSWMSQAPEHTLVFPDAGTWTVAADADDVREVLDRLISNAVKFSPPGPVHVSVHPGMLPPSPGSPSGSRASRPGVRLVVADQGIGIPETDQHRVGAPFFKASNARELETQGPGLGVATAIALAGGWGGEVTLSGSPGTGTRAEVTIPLAVPTEPPHQVD